MLGCAGCSCRTVKYGVDHKRIIVGLAAGFVQQNLCSSRRVGKPAHFSCFQLVEIAADELAPRSKLEDILMSMMIWDASEENKSDYEKIVRVVAC